MTVILFIRLNSVVMFAEPLLPRKVSTKLYEGACLYKVFSGFNMELNFLLEENSYSVGFYTSLISMTKVNQVNWNMKKSKILLPNLLSSILFLYAVTGLLSFLSIAKIIFFLMATNMCAFSELTADRDFTLIRLLFRGGHMSFQFALEWLLPPLRFQL